MGRFLYLLLRLRTKKIVGKYAFKILKLFGVEIPPQVKLGDGVTFIHNAYSVVIHPNTVIKNNVKIFHNVTIGRADPYVPMEQSKMEGIVIEEGAMLCPGAKILCKEGILTVGKNTVVGANAVLTKSTGDNEIWAGVPARKISDR